MFLSEVNIWNFRKFGCGEANAPGVTLRLNPGFNLIVGENDSGKTALVDAIRLMLQTQSSEYFRLTTDDFYIPPDAVSEDNRAKELKIECVFRGLEVKEAKNFIEWMGFEKDKKGIEQYVLRITLIGKRDNGRAYYDVKAGPSDGTQMDAKARELLHVTYLKPLRDADYELTPRKNSRLSQILDGHKAFQDKNSHELINIIKQANKQIENYFRGCDGEGKTLSDQNGKELHKEINEYLDAFSSSREPEVLSSNFAIAEMKLRAILEKLSLDLAIINPGLGSNNLLFIAAELTLLKRQDFSGLKLVLIEEAEAHLHPQAQLRLIDYLEDEASKSKIQLILTTHSPNLASKVNLKNLIVCKNGKVFPMSSDYTLLELGDYAFLQRFLDATKANLFFAQGVILVEGDAENLLVPTIAGIIDLPLSKYGISIVNVGSTAFLRYARIFQRKDNKGVPIPVSCITDNDTVPHERRVYEPGKEKTREDISIEREQKGKRKEELYTGQSVRTFVSPVWTLEYDISLCTSLRKDLYKAILCAKALQNSDKFGVTQEKEKEAGEQVANDFKAWEESGKSAEDIAIEIYCKNMLDSKLSKAIVAQCFSKILAEKDKATIKEIILKERNLSYLVNAIQYAAGKG